MAWAFSISQEERNIPIIGRCEKVASHLMARSFDFTFIWFPRVAPKWIGYGSSAIDLLQILSWSHSMLNKNVVSSTLRFRIVQHTLRARRLLLSRFLNWKNSGVDWGLPVMAHSVSSLRYGIWSAIGGGCVRTRLWRRSGRSAQRLVSVSAS